MKSGTQ